MIYLVNDVYPCVQGEGCQTGIPMIMLRLQGCAVGCPWCDTKQTWETDPGFEVGGIAQALGATPHYAKKVQSEIVYYIKTNYPTYKWVLVSGGEPANFYLKPLVDALHDAGYKAAIETSGTQDGVLGAGFDWVCVSPKINMPGGFSVLSEVLGIADEIKHVVGKQADIEIIDSLLSHNKFKKGVQICLQPVSQSPKATQLCIQTVQDRQWRLSTQVHKYLDLP